jgi:xanthine/CO dehydrogenase XdhC/CoxF family maturation factor
MGWFVTVADGRSNLATRTRFPDTHEVYPLPAGALAFPSLRSTDAAVLMTHSIHQDQRILGALLDHELAYLGVLGPAKRTREMLFDIACERGLTDSSAESQAQRWMRDLHAPIGLDLGARTPAEIALEILAEVQKKLNSATGRPLSEIRGALQPIAS